MRHLFNKQLTAPFDDDALNTIVSTDDEAINKQGPRALVVMISRLVSARCFKLKWALTVGTVHRARDVDRREKTSDGVFTLELL